MTIEMGREARSVSAIPAGGPSGGVGRRLSKALQAILTALAPGDERDAPDRMARHIRDFKRGFEQAPLDIHGPAACPKSLRAADPGRLV